jgi:regulator of replication initiation timing
MRQIDERTRQLEREILQVRNETEQIKKETEQLRQENTRGRQWLASMDALCFPPDANSTPAIATEPDSKYSSP